MKTKYKIAAWLLSPFIWLIELVFGLLFGLSFAIIESLKYIKKKIK